MYEKLTQGQLQDLRKVPLRKLLPLTQAMVITEY